jgi:ferrochelatase
LYQTVAALMLRLGDHPHEFAYQSAAMSPEPWLGPDAGEVLDRLASEGHTNVLMAPIGFVSEHVEILYDIDIALQRRARELGIHLERIDMLNTAPEMIGGLADLVRSAAEGEGWTRQV